MKLTKLFIARFCLSCWFAMSVIVLKVIGDWPVVPVTNGDRKNANLNFYWLKGNKPSALQRVPFLCFWFDAVVGGGGCLWGADLDAGESAIFSSYNFTLRQTSRLIFLVFLCFVFFDSSSNSELLASLSVLINQRLHYWSPTYFDKKKSLRRERNYRYLYKSW